MDEKLFLSVADVAKTLSLGVTYTRRLINRGEIKSVRVGKRVLVPRQCLDEYVSTLMGTTQSA
jgi:excisionase family DNA binding protein